MKGKKKKYKGGWLKQVNRLKVPAALFSVNRSASVTEGEMTKPVYPFITICHVARVS